MRGVWLPVSDGVESWNVFLRGDGEADVKIARACVFPPKRSRNSKHAKSLSTCLKHNQAPVLHMGICLVC